jgi:hypothetical protein
MEQEEKRNHVTVRYAEVEKNDFGKFVKKLSDDFILQVHFAGKSGADGRKEKR